MDELFKEIEKAIVAELSKTDKAPIDETNLKTGEAFHDKYYNEMFDKKVRITLKDKTDIVGYFNDEFYEDASIMVSFDIIRIEDIENIELADD